MDSANRSIPAVGTGARGLGIAATEGAYAEDWDAALLILGTVSFDDSSVSSILVKEGL